MPGCVRRDMKIRENHMTEPIELKDAFKQFTADQDKIMDPQETVTRFRKRLQEVDLDILEKTERIDNGRLDIPVFFLSLIHI